MESIEINQGSSNIRITSLQRRTRLNLEQCEKLAQIYQNLPYQISMIELFPQKFLS